MPSRIKSIHCILLVLFSLLPLLSSFPFSSSPSHPLFLPSSSSSSAASITSYRHNQNIASSLSSPYHHSALSSSSTNIDAPPPPPPPSSSSETASNVVKHKPHQSNNNNNNKNSQRKRKNNNNNTVKWITCSSTTEVNRAISHYVRPGDNVAELGSQLRAVSTTLCETIGPTGTAILVDVQRKFPKYESTKGEEEGRMRRTSAMRFEGDDSGFYEDRARFVETAEFEFWRDALFFAPPVASNNSNEKKGKKNEKPAYDAFVVDMSTVAGNDLELTCISLVREFIALNRRGSYDTNNDDNNNNNSDDNNHNDEKQQQCCRAVIIKSGSLHNLARRLYHAQHILSGARQLPDNHGKYNGGRASIIGAVGVKQYRETVPFVVREGDACVEVGCHLGTTTTIIDAAAKKKKKKAEGTEEGENDIDENGNDGRNAAAATAATSKLGLLSGEGGEGCLGVDVGSSIVASAKKKYPHLSFEVGDGFKTGALARMRYKHFGSGIDYDNSDNNNNNTSHHGSTNEDNSTTSGGAVTNRNPTYDVVYVDIGGLSGSEGLLEAVSLLTGLDNALEPRCIVIKSLCVRRLASCLVPFSEVWRKGVAPVQGKSEK